MKSPLVPLVCLQPAQDAVLNKVLRQCGSYYHDGSLFYQELWRDALRRIGFRVLLVEKFDCHNVWRVRVCGNLTAQTYLLTSKPVPSIYAFDPEILVRQLRSEIREIAKDLGPPIKSDCLTVVKSGAYFLASFIWVPGKPGRLLKKEKVPEAFSFLIRPWLRRNRN